MRTGFNSLLAVSLALVAFSNVEAAPEPDISLLNGAPQRSISDCLQYLPPQRTCDRPVTRTVIDYETQDVSVPTFYEETITSPKLIQQRVDVPNFVQRDVPIRSQFQRNPVEVDIYTVEPSIRRVTRRVPEYVNQTLEVERIALVPRQYVQKQVNFRNVSYKDQQVQFADYEVYEHEVQRIKKEIPVEYIVYQDEEVLVNVVEFRQVPVYVDKYDYQVVPITVDVYEFYDEVYEEKEPQFKDTVVDVDDITYERRKIQVPRVSYKTVTVIEDKVEWSYPRVEVPAFSQQNVNVPTIVQKTVRIPRFQDQTIDVPSYTKQPCSLIRNATETKPCPPCKACNNADGGYNYNTPSNPLQIPQFSGNGNGNGGFNKAPTPSIPILIPNPSSAGNPYAFVPPTNEFEQYEAAASNVEQQQVSADESESDSGSWSHWLPTINAYRKKLGV